MHVFCSPVFEVVDPFHVDLYKLLYSKKTAPLSYVSSMYSSLCFIIKILYK